MYSEGYHSYARKMQRSVDLGVHFPQKSYLEVSEQSALITGIFNLETLQMKHGDELTDQKCYGQDNPTPH